MSRLVLCISHKSPGLIIARPIQTPPTVQLVQSLLIWAGLYAAPASQAKGKIPVTLGRAVLGS